MVEAGILNLPKFSFYWNFYVKERIKMKKHFRGAIYCASNYDFFLCRLALLRFFRLWVATLCLFLFLPLGINQFFIRYFYFTSTLLFTPSTKTFAGLKAGILCAGILMVVFFEMFLPVFSARVFTIKLPKPLR